MSLVIQDHKITNEFRANNNLYRGASYIRENKFYGIFAGGEWAYFDKKDHVHPWKYLGGVVNLFRLEKTSIIVWYSYKFKSGREIYLPKFDGNKLIFIYDFI